MSNLFSVFSSLFGKKDAAESNLQNIPAHIAIIMDGNGRWAQKRGLPRVAGHKVGVESLRTAVKTCDELGVKYLSVYAFSTENWGRPKDEVDFLMGLLAESIEKEIEALDKKNVLVRVCGRIDDMRPDIASKIKASVGKTHKNTGLNLQIMMNYGGRAEIVDAVNSIIAKGGAAKIDEKQISENMYAPEVPDPDLLIRTGGDLRISNYMLWEIAYSEIYVTDTYWPDFRRDPLIKAIEDYSKRKRRFGKI